MLQRSTTVFFIVFMLAFSLMVQAAPTKQHDLLQTLKSAVDTDKLQKRDAGLVHTIGWGFLAVKDGVKSTMSGIRDPTVPGTKEDIEASATEAGTQVGSAIGHAIKSGKLI